MRRRAHVLALGLILLGSSLSLAAATLAGVTMPDTVTVAGKTLVLNGMGVRSKLFIKVYVGGLYLERKSREAGAILQADAPKRIVLHFVYSEAGRDQLIETFREGFANNAAGGGTAVRPQIEQFLATVETMRSGEEMAVTYLPGDGTTFTVKGKDKVKIAGLPFAQALFSLWLGPKPPSGSLKNGLLGK
jgi:hypothetical protein